MSDTKPTHKVSFYGVHCYWNCHTDDLWGVNWLCECGIVAVTCLHSFFAMVCPGAGEDGFPFVVLEEYEPHKP